MRERRQDGVCVSEAGVGAQEQQRNLQHKKQTEVLRPNCSFGLEWTRRRTAK